MRWLLGAILLGGCQGAIERVEEVAITANPLSELEHLEDRTPWPARVLSVRRAGPYSYWELSREGASTWVDGLHKGVAPGNEVRFTPIGRAVDFKSARTGERYDELLFGVLRPLIP